MDEPESATTAGSSGVDWDLVNYIAATASLALLAISITFTLSTALTVCCGKHPRRYGYFHLATMFCLLHVSYFAIKAAALTLAALNSLEFVSDEAMNEVSPLLVYLPDLLTCILGTAMLLLTAMTVDCLFTRCVHSQLAQRCHRVFAVLAAIVTGTFVFLLALVFKFGLILPDFSVAPSIALLVVTSTYLLAFSVLPSFVIVILGTINWVTDRNSSRPLKEARATTRSLDRRILLLSIPLLLLQLVTTIVHFANELKMHEEEESDVTRLFVEVAKIVIDAMFVLYPLMFTCSLGKFCCAGGDGNNGDE